MYLIKKIDQFDEKFVYFGEPIKNNVINDGDFIRILYSTTCIVLNGIYLQINLNNIVLDKHYNKYKSTFSVSDNAPTINKLKDIEIKLLKIIDRSHKIPEYKLAEQLHNGSVKINGDYVSNSKIQLILKISGIWETETRYGLTYKFMFARPFYTF